MKAMLFTKLKAALAIVLALGFVATGLSLLACRTVAGQDNKKPAAEKPVQPVQPATKQEKDKEGFTAWGEKAGGLQAGLGYRPGQHRTYYTGETVTLVVRLRNVSREVVNFQYLPEFFVQKAPAVTDSAGKPAHFRYGVLDTAQVHLPTNTKLAPGKEMVLGELEIPTAVLGTGKFAVQYERVLGKTYQGLLEVDPTLKNLGTGKLELEIKSEPPPAATEQKHEAPSKKTETAKGLKLTLSADKTETRMTPGEEYGALPVKLKLTFTNTSDKPIKLDPYALPFRIGFRCEGPRPDSVHKLTVYVDTALESQDSPVLQPGKSWSPKWTPSFPGDIPDGVGKVVGYVLRDLGLYKLRMTVYENLSAGDEPRTERTPWLVSNELELKVLAKNE